MVSCEYIFQPKLTITLEEKTFGRLATQSYLYKTACHYAMCDSNHKSDQFLVVFNRHDALINLVLEKVYLATGLARYST